MREEEIKEGERGWESERKRERRGKSGRVRG